MCDKLKVMKFRAASCRVSIVKKFQLPQFAGDYALPPYVTFDCIPIAMFANGVNIRPVSLKILTPKIFVHCLLPTKYSPHLYALKFLYCFFPRDLRIRTAKQMYIILVAPYSLHVHSKSPLNLLLRLYNGRRDLFIQNRGYNNVLQNRGLVQDMANYQTKGDLL